MGLKKKMLLKFLEALIDCLNPINIVVLMIIALVWEKQMISFKKKIEKLQEENKYLKDRNDLLEARINDLKEENNHLRKRRVLKKIKGV